MKRPSVHQNQPNQITATTSKGLIVIAKTRFMDGRVAMVRVGCEDEVMTSTRSGFLKGDEIGSKPSLIQAPTAARIGARAGAASRSPRTTTSESK
jgi:hypothetical protein